MRRSAKKGSAEADTSDFRFPVPGAVLKEIRELGEGEVFLDYLLVDSEDSGEGERNMSAVMNTLDRFLKKRPRDSGTVVKPPQETSINLDSSSSSSDGEESSAIKNNFSPKLKDLDSSVGQQKRLSLNNKGRTPVRNEERKEIPVVEDSPIDWDVLHVSQKRNVVRRDSSSSSSSSSGGEEEKRKETPTKPPVNVNNTPAERDSDLESIYSVDLFSQRDRKVEESKEKEVISSSSSSPTPPPSLSKETSPPMDKGSSPPPSAMGRKSVGQKNILDYVKKTPRPGGHELSPSGSETEVKTREKSSITADESNPLESWYRDIKEKDSNALDSIKFDDSSKSGQVFLEDFDTDDEVFIVQCPKEMDVRLLKGKELKLDGEGRLSLKMKNGTLENYDSVGCAELNRVANLILPSRESKKFKLASIALRGSVMISEGVDIPEVVLEEQSPTQRIPLPESIKDRPPTIDKPGSSPEKVKKKKKKKDKDRVDEVSEIQMGKTSGISVPTEEILSSEVPSNVEESLVKHKKKKHKSKVSEISVKEIQAQLLNSLLENLGAQGDHARKEGKKKKRRESENVETNPVDLASNGINNRDASLGEDLKEVLEETKPKKKKKKKDKDKEIEEPQEGIEEVLEIHSENEEEKEPKKKKKKRRKSLDEYNEWCSGGDMSSIHYVPEEEPDDLEEVKPKKKKKKKDKNHNETAVAEESQGIETASICKESKKKRKFEQIEGPQERIEEASEVHSEGEQPKKKRKKKSIDDTQVEGGEVIAETIKKKKKKKKDVDLEERFEDRAAPEVEESPTNQHKKKKKKKKEIEEFEDLQQPSVLDGSTDQGELKKKKKKKRKENQFEIDDEL